MVPAARVQRSRLAFAMAVTVAALPILVLDNFPATAEAADRVVASAVTTTEEPSSTSTSELTTTASTEAPTSTEAPAPVVTEASTSTTVAPTTTTTKAPVRTLVAPRPTTTTTTVAAPPTTEPPAYDDPDDPATWDRLAQCEADGDWAADTGNGYYGGLQFSLSTWQQYGGTGYPDEASRETQIEIGRRLQAAKGWGAWPGCAAKLGYS